MRVEERIVSKWWSEGVYAGCAASNGWISLGRKFSFARNFMNLQKSQRFPVYCTVYCMIYLSGNRRHGIEPRTCGIANRCSTTELPPLDGVVVWWRGASLHRIYPFFCHFKKFASGSGIGGDLCLTGAMIQLGSTWWGGLRRLVEWEN